MDTVTLAHAQAHLSELLERVEAGEAIAIEHNGHLVAMNEIERPPQSRQPLDLAALDEFRATMPRLHRPSVELIREMRDEDL